MIGRGAIGAALLVLAGLASASEKPGKVAIVAGSTDAAIIVRAPSRDARYQLILARYDPATATAGSGFQRGDAVVTVMPFRKDGDYWVTRLRPGHYVVNRLIQQNKWAVCFHAATVTFEIGAGQVLHLGSFAGDRPLAELQAAALAGKQDRAGTFQSFTYYDRISAPVFAAPDAAELAAANAFVHQEMPRTQVGVASATLRPAQFRLTNIFTGERQCGGELGKPAVEGG